MCLSLYKGPYYRMLPSLHSSDHPARAHSPKWNIVETLCSVTLFPHCTCIWQNHLRTGQRGWQFESATFVLMFDVPALQSCSTGSAVYLCCRSCFCSRCWLLRSIFVTFWLTMGKYLRYYRICVNSNVAIVFSTTRAFVVFVSCVIFFYICQFTAHVFLFLNDSNTTLLRLSVYLSVLTAIFRVNLG